ncbi:MAG: GWxTD domain-containing protein [Flavobacteriales bacterium]
MRIPALRTVFFNSDFCLARGLLRIFPFFFLLAACGDGTEWQKDPSDRFPVEDQGLDPAFRLYHASADSSLLYFRVSHDRLLYTRKSEGAPFRAKVKVKARVIGEEGKLHAIDSTFVQDEGKNDGGRSLGRFSLTWDPMVKKGRVHIETRDMKRGREVRERLYFDREGPNAKQNFLPVKPDKGEPYFKNSFSAGERVGFRYEREDPEKVLGRAYFRDFPLPPPPFAEDEFRRFDYEADSLFTIELDSAHYLEIEVPDSGFYHLQVDSGKGKKGFTLFNFQKGYPKVKTVEAMLGPIRFLTSPKEFQKLSSSDDLKGAVDSFWVARGGSHERARKLIEAYYGRVETANEHFTSHVEGWKTDRGLIHIIFGEPERIEKSKTGERWVYGDGNEIMNLNFEFERVDNPFTNKDLSLDRNGMYKRGWYRAIEAWRNGRVYSH